MARVIFHIGMGKTGTTTIQAALKQSSFDMLAQGRMYLGQWLDIIGPEFDSFDGFQLFLRQSEGKIAESAQQFVENVGRIVSERNVETVVFSNEQYLENIGKLSGFFNAISRAFDLQVVVYVRPPANWLPSAYLQWGVVHKTNPGPVRPFRVKARELMGQYRYVRQWREIFGPKLIVRQFNEGTDVVADFAECIGVTLKPDGKAYQKRPSPSESIMRAACNNLHPGMALPSLYQELYASKIAPSTPASVTEKYRYLYDDADLPAILAENAETLSYLETEFGLDLSDRPSGTATVELSKVSDELLGMLIDLVFSQAHRIRDLTGRIEELERR